MSQRFCHDPKVPFDFFDLCVSHAACMAQSITNAMRLIENDAVNKIKKPRLAIKS